jgi:zinc and cadmium transporter
VQSDPNVWAASLFAVIAVSGVSLVGIVVGRRWLQNHAVLLTLVALAAGALLGDALLHLLPEAAEKWGEFGVELATLVLAGFVAFFLMESVLRYGHAHGEKATDAHAGHSHQIQPFGWMNLASDGLHNFVDGVIIAAAFSTGDLVVGLAATIAVALHEIPQEIGDYAVLVRAGFARNRALLWNFASAAIAILGAILFLLLPFDPEALQRIALPVTAGGFIYIAAADLIPELHHHTGDRHSRLIIVGLLAGLGIMFGLLLLEHAH